MHSPESIAAMEAAGHEIMEGTEMATQSDERAALFEQDIGDFESYKTDEKTGDRLPATPEQEQEMDRRLTALHDLFSGSDIPWRLDGAMNISIYKGEYIGHHKDVDLSVPRDRATLEALDEWLG